MKRSSATIFHLFIMLTVMLGPALVGADEDRTDDLTNLNVSVQLRHRVVIPQIIYLRVGSATFGEVDEVKFDLTDGLGLTQGTSSYDGSGNPLGNSTPVAATNNGTLVVDLRSNVGTVTLSYTASNNLNNSLGMYNGSGHYLAFSEIDTQSSDADFPAPTLLNSSAGTETISGNLYNGRVVNRQAGWTYSYKNTTIPVAGTYTGRVSYTASAP